MADTKLNTAIANLLLSFKDKRREADDAITAAKLSIYDGQVGMFASLATLSILHKVASEDDAKAAVKAAIEIADKKLNTKSAVTLQSEMTLAMLPAVRTHVKSLCERAVHAMDHNTEVSERFANKYQCLLALARSIRAEHEAAANEKRTPKTPTYKDDAAVAAFAAANPKKAREARPPAGKRTNGAVAPTAADIAGVRAAIMALKAANPKAEQQWQIILGALNEAATKLGNTSDAAPMPAAAPVASEPVAGVVDLDDAASEELAMAEFREFQKFRAMMATK